MLKAMAFLVPVGLAVPMFVDGMRSGGYGDPADYTPIETEGMAQVTKTIPNSQAMGMNGHASIPEAINGQPSGKEGDEQSAKRNADQRKTGADQAAKHSSNAHVDQTQAGGEQGAQSGSNPAGDQPQGTEQGATQQSSDSGEVESAKSSSASMSEASTSSNTESTASDGKSQKAQSQDSESEVDAGDEAARDDETKTAPAAPSSSQEAHPTGFRTFRPQDYHVPLWIGSSAYGYINSEGSFAPLAPQSLHKVSAHRDFDDQEELMQAVDAEVEKGRMVVVNYRHADFFDTVEDYLLDREVESMRYPVGSRPVEVLTLASERDASIKWSPLAGLALENGGSKITAVVFEPAASSDELVGAKPQIPTDIEPLDDALFESTPHAWPIIASTRQEVKSEGPRSALESIPKKIDPWVDYGRDYLLQSDFGSDEGLIEELLRGKTKSLDIGDSVELEGDELVWKAKPEDAISLENDNWVSHQFAAFAHWVGWQSGAKPLILIGSADTEAAGDGPGEDRAMLMYRSDDDVWRSVDPSLPNPYPANPPDSTVDLDKMIDFQRLASVVADCIVGAVVLGGAGLGLWGGALVRNARRRRLDAAQQALKDQLEARLKAMSDGAGLGVFVTMQSAIAHWIEPDPASLIGQMSQGRQLQSLVRTYLHEIGAPVDHPLDEDRYRQLVDVLAKSNEVGRAPGSPQRLGSLLSELKVAAAREFSKLDNVSEKAQRDFAHAQAVLGEVINALKGGPTDA